MPISFIAVQCFECSTMQVKQQKKSSNKWSCVVCNQKQSVRNVFAQSFMAKDVRKFVQNFNMSRQISDQKQSLYNDEPQPIIVASPKIEEHKRKRNDWTEYIDDDQEEHNREFERGRNFVPGDDGFEPLIVTEMPKATFVKPKVKDYFCSRSENLLKPSFPKRRDGKSPQIAHSRGRDVTGLERDSNRDESKRDHEDNRSQALKWNNFMAQIRGFSSSAKDENYSNVEHQKTVGKKVSKWSSFITDEDHDGDNGGNDDHKLENRERGDDHQLELWMNDERVEEDIHPDFL